MAFFCRFLGGGLEVVASRSANTVERSIPGHKHQQLLIELR
jgi:hypothetical protein